MPHEFGQEDLIHSLLRHKDVSRTLFLFFLAISVSACGDLANLLGSEDDEELPTSDQFTEPIEQCEGSAIPDRFIVRWKNGEVTVVSAKNRREFFDTTLLKFKDEIDVAEYDFVVKLSDPPTVNTANDDEAEKLNWGIEKIEAESVWDQNEIGSGVIVAVIDSGVDADLSELSGQFFVNDGETSNNGIDDDGNGFVDDVSGWDFYLESPDVEDRVGHGSHVAGVIAARHDVGEILGVAPGVQILPLNFMDESGSGTLGDAVEAISYAVDMGAKVINASWGGAPCSEILQDEISGLEGHDVLFIAAAGNNGVNIEDNPEYPASFELDPQITVGASTENDFMAGFSNRSRSLVELVAPGNNIVSTVPDIDPDAMKSGTSMAAPFVSGAAAVIWSAVPDASPDQVKQALMESVDEGPFEVETAGRLNLNSALNRLRELVP